MKKKPKIIASLFIVLLIISFYCSVYAVDYSVVPGDTLWKISNKYNVEVLHIIEDNDVDPLNIYEGMVLKLREYAYYTVKSGDSLWLISKKFETSVDDIKKLNGLKTNTIYIDQKILLYTKNTHRVKKGESLWLISKKYDVSLYELKSANNITGDIIYVGQVLLIPKGSSSSDSSPNDNTQWPSITYIVKEGDTPQSIANKFGISVSNILKYNYYSEDEYFSAGQKIAISGYAPRHYAVVPWEDNGPTKYGKLVDWYYDGQYILKRWKKIIITDVKSGLRFNATVIGGYNHADIETDTKSDTAIMHKMFNYNWEWTPRPVVVYIDGMNIAASLSGMPHSFDIISGNNMNGHCDLYLKNSRPHGSYVSEDYVQQHYEAVYDASR